MRLLLYTSADLISSLFEVQRDFMCPRDLLMHEMPFFTERLSDEAHLGKLFDISVHCDVSIFQWLMSYVKRGMPDDKGVQIQQPKIGMSISWG